MLGARSLFRLIAVGAAVGVGIPGVVIADHGTREAGTEEAAPAQRREVCVGGEVSDGWIVVDARWVPTKCGNPTSIEDNVWVVERYADKPPGTTMVVCTFARTPPGWEVVGTAWSATQCEDTSVSEHNTKRIRRLADTPDEDDAAALLGAVLGGILAGAEHQGDADEGERTLRLTGVYSDMARVEETGDIVGTEIFLLVSTDGMEVDFHALVQFAEGVPEPPQLVDVDVRGASIEFEATFLGRPVRFRGRVTADSLEGELDGLSGEVSLPRGRSFWQ